MSEHNPIMNNAGGTGFENRHSNELTVTRYRFSLQGQSAYGLEPFEAGPVLRGAFGKRFRALYCPDLDRPDCHTCGQYPSCLYARTFCPAPPPGSDRLRNLSDIPRPFVFKPPLERCGQQLVFDMVWMHEFSQYIPAFAATWHDMALCGLGRKRIPGRLLSVDCVDRRGRAGPAAYQGGVSIQNASLPLTYPVGGNTRESTQPGRIEVRFLTPTHLKFDGRDVGRPDFHHVFKRARDRINALATFYGRGPLDLDFAALGLRSEAVRTFSTDLRWISRNRRSSRTGRSHPMVGVVGKAVYTGAISEFVPLLQAAEQMHLGKGAAFGQGWIKLRVLDP